MQGFNLVFQTVDKVTVDSLFKNAYHKYRVWNQFYAQDMSGDRSQFGISLVSWIKY